ncbi:MAG: VOC family protein [Gammaproteobacteria bacterium]
MRASLDSITPLIPTGTSRLAASLAFYTQHMGFSIVWRNGNMAGIQRERIAFNLVENSNKEWVENASFSIAVSDLNALYQEYRGIPAKVGPLEVKAWGRREFHLIVPSGVCFQFYQSEHPSATEA